MSCGLPGVNLPEWFPHQRREERTKRDLYKSSSSSQDLKEAGEALFTRDLGTPGFGSRAGVPRWSGVPWIDGRAVSYFLLQPDVVLATGKVRMVASAWQGRGSREKDSVSRWHLKGFLK